MPFRWKVALGFAAAPFASLLATMLWFAASWLARLGPWRHTPFSTMLAEVRNLGGPIASVATTVALVVGLPTFLFLFRRGVLGLGQVLRAGAVVGAAPLLAVLALGVVMAVWQGLSWGWTDPHFGVIARLASTLSSAAAALWWLLLCGFCGFVSAWMFWLIALKRWRRHGSSLPSVNSWADS